MRRADSALSVSDRRMQVWVWKALNSARWTDPHKAGQSPEAALALPQGSSAPPQCRAPGPVRSSCKTARLPQGQADFLYGNTAQRTEKKQQNATEDDIILMYQ